MNRFTHALANGTGAVLSKLAVISIPFLLSTAGYLLNATLIARDEITRQELKGLGGKIDALAGRVDTLADVVRATNDRSVATLGDVRELQAQQRATERRLDERSRR
jgi:hypothetical protein